MIFFIALLVLALWAVTAAVAALVRDGYRPVAARPDLVARRTERSPGRSPARVR